MSRTKLILVVALCLAMAGCARFRVKQALWAEKRGMSVQKEEQDSTIHPQWGAALFK